MKRYVMRLLVLLLAGMLVSCGGGGDGSGGTTPVAADGGTPGSTDGGTPGTPDDPAAPGGGTTGSTSGDTTGSTSGGTTGSTSGGTTGSTSGDTTGSTGGGSGTAGPLAPPGALVEESDPEVTLTGDWVPSDSRYGWSGGAAMESTVPGATASFSFTGTSVRWIGHRSKRGGLASLSLDGGAPIEVNLHANPTEMRTPIITLYGLSDGPHTLTIEVKVRPDPGSLQNLVVVDAFEVEPEIVSHLQDRDPDATYSEGWVILDNNQWSGGGVRTVPDPAIGGASATETAGANMTLTFRGTSIRWIGYRGPGAGIARVTLDGGAPTEVDLYAAREKIQEVVFTATGLADASHTLTIEATGRKNDASTGVQIVVDAFDVTTPGRRYQERHSAITYSGAWAFGSTSRVWSEGMVSQSNTPGSTATFSFTGTSVSWIGCQKSSCGARARIYIDGAPVAEVRNSQPVPIEGFQHTIFRADGLSDGPHTLTIEVLSTGSYIVVDGFDVHP